MERKYKIDGTNYQTQTTYFLPLSRSLKGAAVEVTVHLVQDVPQPLGWLFVGVEEHCLEIDGKSVAEDWLDKHLKCLNVDPCTEALTEVDFEPTDKWTLSNIETLTKILEL